jgi:hypothetical protein
MKSTGYKFFGVIILSVILLINLNWSIVKKGNSDLLLKNVLAIEQARAEEGSSKVWRCWATYSSCWFWNCSTIYRCGNPCTTVSVDSYSDWDACSAI